MARVYLGIGSNMDAEAKLRFGIEALRGLYGELRLSTVYRNKAAGFDGPDFLNLVAGFDTTDSPQAVHVHLEAIHEAAGRKRGEDPYSSRPLDIDLLLYDDLVVNEPPVRLPRSDVLQYSFVLGPLAEIAPELRHPVTGLTMQEHWREYDRDSHPLTPTEVSFRR